MAEILERGDIYLAGVLSSPDELHTVDPAEFLDTDGAELVVISAGADVEDELGGRLDVAAETAGTAEILAELPLEADRPLAPLLRGERG